MNGLLKNQPMPEGNTAYCNKDFHLVNHHANLENTLQKTSKTLLGTRSFGALGLPDGISGGVSKPNIYKQGQALPQPYGPIDNLRMQSLFDIHGFGSKKAMCKKAMYKKLKKLNRKSIKLTRKIMACNSKVKSRKVSKAKSRKAKSRKAKSRKVSRKFGTTPGTEAWQMQASGRNSISSYMNQFAKPELKEASGFIDQSVKLYDGPASKNMQNVIGNPNEPAQYTKNELNSPVFKYGKRRSRPMLSRRRRRFGPNVVGYESHIPVYHAGSNTINFANNKLFVPNMVADIGKVQGDGMTPNAWLTQSVGIGDGLGNKYRFGSVYTANGLTNGSGHNVIQQPDPPYMETSEISETSGNFMYGKKSKDGKHRSRPKKELSSCFGGSVITLNSAGQITVTN